MRMLQWLNPSKWDFDWFPEDKFWWHQKDFYNVPIHSYGLWIVNIFYYPAGKP
jgi:hypothetical protein